MADIPRLESALSSIHWTFRHDEALIQPWNLVNALKISLPAIAPETWEARLDWGGVYVNGRMKTHDVELPCPCVIEYFEPKYPFEERHSFYPEFSPSWILFEDDDAVVVYKPAGLPCLPSREQRHMHLKSYVERHFRQQIHMPSRLDTSTAGLLVMSRSSRMNRHIQQAFEYRRVAKYYIFETAVIPEWTEKLVEAPIGKDCDHPVLRRIDPDGGKEARTLFTRVCMSEISDIDGNIHPSCLISARPMTGRTHQIRTHAAYLGIPVAGDNFYQGFHVEGLRLLSYRVDFHHPFIGEDCSVILPEVLWPEWAAPGIRSQIMTTNPELKRNI